MVFQCDMESDSHKKYHASDILHDISDCLNWTSVIISFLSLYSAQMERTVCIILNRLYYSAEDSTRHTLDPS